MILDANTKAERLFLSMGAGAGFLAVALGAFGAHALFEKLPSDRFAIFETASRYLMFHAFALLAVGLFVTRRRGRAAPAAGWLFAIGIVIFCGSLYLLALTGARWWGAVTPFGGLAWLLAWLLLGFSAFRSPRQVVALDESRDIEISAPPSRGKAGSGFSG